MTHENNPATYLIKQGDKLYWKNPNDDKGFDKTIGLPLFAVRYNEDFERYSKANPIHAIGDWPDKEEFSREEVEIIHAYKDMPEFDGNDARLAARYKGEQPADINAGQSEETKQRDINVTLLEEQPCSECGSNNYTYFSDDTKNLNHFYSCSQNPVNMKSEERKKEQGDLFQPLYAALNEFNRSNDVTNAAYSTLLFAAKQIESKLSHNEEPSSVEQFRAEVIKKLEAEFEHHPKYTAIYGVFRHAIEIVKSVK